MTTNWARWLVLGSVLATVPGCGGAGANSESVEVTDPLRTVTGEELYEQAVALAEQEDYVRAEQYLSAAIQRGFDENRAMPLLVSVCVRSSRLAAALGYAEPYLARHPEAWSLRLLVGAIHMGLGDVQEAENEFVRVTEDQPSDPTAPYMLAVLARDARNDMVAAEAWFRRYLEIAPEGEHAREARALVARREAGGTGALPVRIESAPEEQGADGAQELVQ